MNFYITGASLNDELIFIVIPTSIWNDSWSNWLENLHRWLRLASGVLLRLEELTKLLLSTIQLVSQDNSIHSLGSFLRVGIGAGGVSQLFICSSAPVIGEKSGIARAVEEVLVLDGFGSYAGTMSHWNYLLTLEVLRVVHRIRISA